MKFSGKTGTLLSISGGNLIKNVGHLLQYAPSLGHLLEYNSIKSLFESLPLILLLTILCLFVATA